MQKCIENIMSGKNLSYSYLLWIEKNAIRLGLKGIAFFKNDGSIKVIAEGEERKLFFL
jgi:acylphosphatase